MKRVCSSAESLEPANLCDHHRSRCLQACPSCSRLAVLRCWQEGVSFQLGLCLHLGTCSGRHLGVCMHLGLCMLTQANKQKTNKQTNTSMSAPSFMCAHTDKKQTNKQTPICLHLGLCLHLWVCMITLTHSQTKKQRNK